jgi:hypothetical protein
MSYSRWSNSIWYTFWSYSRSPKKEDQLFEICPIKSFTYKELKENGFDKSIESLKKHMLKHKNKNKLFFSDLKFFNEKDFEELKIYMKEFIEDIENDKTLI